MQVAEIFNTMSYGPAPENTQKVDAWLQSHRQGFGLFINGEWVTPAETFDSFNPANGQPLAKVGIADNAHVDTAIGAAHAAQPGWEKLGGHGRARYLYTLVQLLQEHAREFAVLESLDSGKPIRESNDIDIPLAIRQFQHYAGWAQIVETEFPAQRALGVAGLIISSSFPLLAAARQIAPALASGNCVVLKPAQNTSLTALMFARLCAEAGLPAGVVNVVTGSDETGEHLAGHPDIDKLDFAGSTSVGHAIRQRAAGSGKKLTLELSGRSPFIVFEDADLDAAVEGLVDGFWCNQGQASRFSVQLLVQEGVEARLLEKIRARMEKLRVGDPLDNNSDLGAIGDSVQYQRIAELVERAVDEGAELWQADSLSASEGRFYPPTLLTSVGPTNVVAREDVFGPVVSVTSFRLVSEAVQLVDSNNHCPAASVWSENINRALEVAAQLGVSTVCVNSSDLYRAATCCSGREDLEEYLHPRYQFTREERALDPAKKTNAATSHAPEATGVLSNDGLPPIAGPGDRDRVGIHSAVGTAHKAREWSRYSGHHRARVLYRMAEHLSEQAQEFVRCLAHSAGGISQQAAEREVESTLHRLFTYAAWADKYDGAVRQSSQPGVALTLNEAIGVIGIGCPESLSLLSLVSLLVPALAAGNRVVLVLSEESALMETGLYRMLNQLLESAGMPTGTANIVTGAREKLMQTLAGHAQVDGVWYFGSTAGSKLVELASVHSAKQIWVNNGKHPDWLSREEGEGRHFLREACAVKRVWIPCGE